METKYCIDCAHYQEHKTKKETFHRCLRQAKQVKDLVTGKTIYRDTLACGVERSNHTGTKCGFDAIYFKPIS